MIPTEVSEDLFSEVTTSAHDTPDYADGRSFPSVLAPMSSPWTLFPVAFMVSFIFLFLFRAKFWLIYAYMEERLWGDSVRFELESRTPEFDQITKAQDPHPVRPI